jgi:hypothetical protein
MCLAACGGVKSTIDPVAEAASKSANAGGVRMQLDASFTVSGTSASFSAEGVFDGDEGELTMDMGDLLGQAGLPGGPMKVISTKEDGEVVLYMQMPALAGFVPGGKPWLKLNMQDAMEAQGVGGSARDLFGASSQNPAEALELLKKVADVTEVGSETIDGVETTRYSAVVDVEEALEQAGAPPEALAAVSSSGLSTTVPVDVWVGEDDGYVRRMTITYDANVSGQAFSGKVTMTLTDWGTDVSVEAPPADEVFDASALLSQLGRG